MPQLVILADDLSGAADCGIVCAEAGLRTLVILGDRDTPADADVLSVDADTRGRSEAEAVAETGRLTRRYAVPGALLYKKLDSTLRGHVGAELTAILRASGHGRIVLAPAYPATGRITAGGVQLLHGVPLDRTEIWRREGMSGDAFIPDRLRRAGLRTALVPLALVRQPGLAEILAAGDHDATVCDAETDADLCAIAAAIGPGTIWAGSAGLARHLPAAAGLARTARRAVAPPVAGPILFVVGSASAVSRGQVAVLEEQAGIMSLTIPAAVLRAGPGQPGWAAEERRLDDAIGSGSDVVALLGADAEVDFAEGSALCQALARLVAPHAARLGALVSAGGETARAVLQAFRADGLHLVGEIEPGVALSIAGGIHHLPVVTKAGAFGMRDTFIRCRTVLRRGTSFWPEPTAP